MSILQNWIKSNFLLLSPFELKSVFVSVPYSLEMGIEQSIMAVPKFDEVSLQYYESELNPVSFKPECSHPVA